MGRPEPCILFAQTFVHSQLDEYVDEVLFAEPIVVTACEFLEQNASLSTPAISLIGATSPPSFALEVFVHCEGESRFRRLCQPFLYSHSSSNVLEVEAVITNHLVVRGCYRSLTLIVYGNTAEDLGQFNIEFDLDNSLASLVSSPSEGKLEDLPPALFSDKLTLEESISSTKFFSLPVPDSDLSCEMKKFLMLTLKIYQISDDDIIHKIVRNVVSAVCSYITSDYHGAAFIEDKFKFSNFTDRETDAQKVLSTLTDGRKELYELYKCLQTSPGDEQLVEEETTLEPDADLATSKLVDVLYQCFPFLRKATSVDLPVLSQNQNLILGLSMVLLFCSAREGCYWFVNGGGMEQIAIMIGQEVHRSTAFTLLLLGAVEIATRNATGCEGFLGWWPREDDAVPIGKSDGYSNILKLLLKKQRHDVASLATYVLHRLRSYEIASRYESAVLSAFANPLTDKIDLLLSASSQLKQMMKLLTTCGPIDDPSPASSARGSIVPGRSEGLLSYSATANFIGLSKYSFSRWDIDKHLLSLLKERGFFPLSAALLSSPKLRSANGSTADIFVDIATSIESLLLSLLFCRSGLTFLLLQPEATATMILSLQGVGDRSRAECLSLRLAAVLISKGFFCHPQEVAMISEIHLRVVIAIDRLLTTTPHSDEFLWVLWDLCSISRSDCGRQALLSICYFPEAVSVLMEALHSFKDSEPVDIDNGTSLSLATFHSAAEIFEVIVTDSTASSLSSWIGHAMELHKALHLSSPGSNRKDAPTRLLEWIDAGVVYHKNGAIGLLRYAAVLASGGDAHLTSTSVLVSDSMDVENVVGDSSNTSDAQVVDILLGKLVLDKFFDGVTLRNTSIVQLTTAIRILSFISENSAVAASLYEEGAVTLIYVVLINCKCMLQQSSNAYDHLVDEGAECNATSDLLLERSHEQGVVDLMIPSLVLLINLLQKLQEAKEQYRNKKLLNALLQLHREVSSKLAACATDSSSPYPNPVLGFGAVCQLLASALACWPIFGWTPGLFHCLLESVQATSSLVLGPKDACSILCLLGDLFPEEDIWFWNNGTPPLSALRILSVETILSPQGQKEISWFLQPQHLKVLLVRLTPQLERIAQVVLHFSFTTLVVIQDMLRVFIIRIGCQSAECAVVLLRPLILWFDNHINETTLSDMDIFKVYRFLDFAASLLEHPCAKMILLKADAIRVLTNILKRCTDAYIIDGKLNPENKFPSRSATSLLSWIMPLLKSFALIFEARQSIAFSEQRYDKCFTEDISIEDSSIIAHQLLRLCQVLPVGRELLACVVSLKELASSGQGRSGLVSLFSQIRPSVLKEHGPDERDTENFVSDSCDWRLSPPFLLCWKKLLRSLDARDDASTLAVETIYALSLSALCLCLDGESTEGLSMLKCLFGLPFDQDGDVTSPGESPNYEQEMINVLDQRISDEKLVSSNKGITLLQVKESVKSMSMLLQSPLSSAKLEDVIPSECLCSSQSVPYLTMTLVDDGTIFSHVWKANENAERDINNISLGGLAEKFLWECPDDRLMPGPPGKRKITSTEISVKRTRDNSGSEAVGSNAFSRGLNMPVVASGPSRRDTFRQRKPNTSRPPSMHVDDYVARERNVDGAISGSHLSSSQRGGSTSGRPPSIHVDEFEARQRERRNPAFVTVGDTPQVRPPVHENRSDLDKSDRSRQLKADLDDDLQEIDIVFDEESASDDRLPFPQPDDNLQSATVIIGESSPGSVVEETEGNANEGAQFSQLGTSQASKDIALHSETALKRSVSQPEVSKKVSASMDKNLPPQQPDELRYASQVSGSKGFDVLPPGNQISVPPHLLNVSSAPPLQPLPPPNFHQRGSPQKGVNGALGSVSHGYYEHKFPTSQPPLPPTPPPNVSAISPQKTTEIVQGHSSPCVHRDAQPPLISGYPLQAFNVSGATNLHLQSENISSTNSGSLASLTASQPNMDNKFLWNTDSTGGRVHVDNYASSTPRPMPPLPPTPPPFSTPMTQPSSSNSGSQSSFYTHTINVGGQLPPLSTPVTDNPLGIFSGSGASLTYSLPQFSQPLLLNRPGVPGSLFSSPSQQHSQIPSSISQSISSPQPSVQSVQPQPPPPPPPQLPRPPHPAHNIGLPIQVQQPQFEQLMPLQQNSVQVQVQSLQIPQQLHIPQLHLLYQSQQHEHLSRPPQPPLEQSQQINPVDSALLQQIESGMTLQQYFASPEAIQSLLSDRDKLCQLLEQHPKLMQMLQERLGQL